MSWQCLPVELVYQIASFADDSTGLCCVNKEVWDVLQRWLLLCRARRSALRAVCTQLLIQENSLYCTYLRRLSHGIYRCRSPSDEYDHLFIRMDTYQSFIRESGTWEDGMFVPGVVFTEEDSTRGMLSFDRFVN